VVAEALTEVVTERRTEQSTRISQFAVVVVADVVVVVVVVGKIPVRKLNFSWRWFRRNSKRRRNVRRKVRKGWHRNEEVNHRARTFPQIIISQISWVRRARKQMSCCVRKGVTLRAKVIRHFVNGV
jgi:hypothetical protein